MSIVRDVLVPNPARMGPKRHGLSARWPVDGRARPAPTPEPWDRAVVDFSGSGVSEPYSAGARRSGPDRPGRTRRSNPQAGTWTSVAADQPWSVRPGGG